MSHQQVLGSCPHCGAGIRPADVLIEYEKDGERTAYAECPNCVTVVRPSSASSSEY